MSVCDPTVLTYLLRIVQSNVWGTFICDPTVKISDGSHNDSIIFGNTKSIANQKMETSIGYHSDHELAVAENSTKENRRMNFTENSREIIIFYC